MGMFTEHEIINNLCILIFDYWFWAHNSWINLNKAQLCAIDKTIVLPMAKTIVRRLKVKFRKCDNQILSKCGPSTRDENE